MMGSDALFCCAYRQSTHIHTIHKGILKRRKTQLAGNTLTGIPSCIFYLIPNPVTWLGSPVAFLFSIVWADNHSPFAGHQGTQLRLVLHLMSTHMRLVPFDFSFSWLQKFFSLPLLLIPLSLEVVTALIVARIYGPSAPRCIPHQVLCLREINCVSYTSIQSQRYSKTAETTHCKALCPLRPSALQLPVLSPQISHLNPHTRLLMRVLCYLTHGRTWKGKWARAGRREEGEHKGRCIIITCSFHGKHALLWGKQALVLWSTSVTSMTQRIQECSKLTRSFFY